MRPLPPPPRRGESGASTCEYATGVVGATCIGALLWLLVREGFFTSLVQSILDALRSLDYVVVPNPWGLM